MISLINVCQKVSSLYFRRPQAVVQAVPPKSYFGRSVRTPGRHHDISNRDLVKRLMACIHFQLALPQGPRTTSGLQQAAHIRDGEARICHRTVVVMLTPETTRPTSHVREAQMWSFDSLPACRPVACAVYFTKSSGACGAVADAIGCAVAGVTQLNCKCS
jgi:hypothetical protein